MMRFARTLAVLALALLGLPVVAQTPPPNLQPNSVWGRFGVGQPGPGQSIPFSQLAPFLTGAACPIGGFEVSIGSNQGQCSTTVGSLALLRGSIGVGALGTPGGLIPSGLGCSNQIIDVSDGVTYSLNLNGCQNTFYAMGKGAGYAWFAAVGSTSQGPAYALTINGQNCNAGDTCDNGLHLLADYQSFAGTTRQPVVFTPFWTYWGAATGGFAATAPLNGFSPGPQTASFTATISGKTMNVSAVASGTLQVGQLVSGAGCDNLFITVSPGGGTGSYTLSASCTVGSGTSMTSAFFTYANGMAMGWSYRGTGEWYSANDNTLTTTGIAYTWADWNHGTQTLTDLVAIRGPLNSTQPGMLQPLFGIAGRTNGSNVGAGGVGEDIPSIVNNASAISVTTTSPVAITSITLTPGDWDVWGTVVFKSSLPGSTFVCLMAGGIALVNNPDFTLLPASQFNETPGYGLAIFNFANVPTISGQNRFNVSVNTVVYLVGFAQYSNSSSNCGSGSGGDVHGYGQIQGRRR